MSLGSLTIDEFLARLGSSDPTPGGGALAALSGAMAAAMLAMVCNLTVGRPRFSDVEAEVRALLEKAEALQRQLLDLADADADAYTAVRDAYRLPRATDEDQQTRADAIEQSMHHATEVPVDSALAARAVLDLAAKAAETTNPVALGDVAVATHLALGAARGAADQARLNLATLKDPSFIARMGEQIDRLLAEADVVAVRALQGVATRGGAG
jgi:formiminotetrahydrofolate cyclodeaminase